MIALPRWSARVAAPVFAAGLIVGTPVVLVSHQRDVALWKTIATDRVSQVGTHLERAIRDVVREAADIVRDRDSVGGEEYTDSLPALVSGIQLITNGEVVAERYDDLPLPEMVTCSEHQGRGATTSLMLYQILPSLRVAACIPLDERAEAERWLVVWLDIEELFETTGLRNLPEEGFHYRLLDVSRGVATSLESSREASWSNAVRHEIALPSGRWSLELVPRDPELLHLSITAGGAFVFLASGLLGLVIHRMGSEPDRLRRELILERQRANTLDERLTDEFDRRRSVEEELERGARYDDLTALPNRAFFVDRVNAALHGTRRYGAPATLLLFDVGRLRVFNDTMGRAVGDQLLRAVGRRIQRALRPEDVLGRAGSGEFGALMFRDGAVEDTVRFVEAVLDDIEEPISLTGSEVFISCHVGIVVLTPSYERGEDVLRDATIALNQARDGDGRRLQVFGREMHEHALRLLETETDLRRAVEREEMVAYYQPILSLSTGRIIGLETLARWHHPVRGLVFPDDFIPIAEQTGVVLHIDRWNLGEGARQIKTWQAAFPRENPLKLSANLAANQLSQPDVVDFVAKLFDDTGLDPRTVALEVTESGVMKNPESAARILAGLKRLGVHLHLDDFGTGYSSLAYLHRFSFDLIKIDKSFVGRMTTDDKSYELVRTVMTLARALGMTVVAEGIETTEQLASLREMGCDYGQGYLFSKPVPPADIEALLSKDPAW